jgi:hypothetical protein
MIMGWAMFSPDLGWWYFQLSAKMWPSAMNLLIVQNYWNRLGSPKFMEIIFHESFSLISWWEKPTFSTRKLSILERDL